MPAEGGTKAARWALFCDELDIVIRCPMEVRSVQRSFGLQVTEVGGWTDGSRSAIPSPSAPERIAVTGIWMSEHAEDDITGVEENIVRLTQKSPNLGRRPLVSFQWAHINMDPAQLSMCDIAYEHGCWPVGKQLIRSFTATIEVQKAQERLARMTERFERETRYVTLSAGETFEMVAWETYGDPDQGELLRRINTHLDVAGEQAGDVIKVLDPDHSDVLSFSPDLRSPAFVGESSGYIQRIAASRWGRRGKSVAQHEAELGL